MKLTMNFTYLLITSALLTVAACSSSDSEETAGGIDGPHFSLMNANFGEGMLLSGYTMGDELIMVGGNIKGGEGMIARYDGDSLCIESPAPAEKAIWWLHGTGDTEFYAVGTEGLIIHEIDGIRTREDVDTSATLYGVWVVSSDEAWAVGGDVMSNRGEIWHRTADAGWESFASDLDGVVFKVWNEWFAGVQSSYHIESGKLVSYPTTAKLTTLRGRSDDDIYAIGGGASVDFQHFDGTEWTDVAIEGDWGVGAGVWTAPDEDVWLAGTSGFMAYYDGTDLHTPDYPLTTETFHAVWPFQDEMVFIGGNFLTSSDDYYSVLGRYGDSDVLFTPTVCK